jgi:predicted DNA-binding transcriptional regulator AlpA
MSLPPKNTRRQWPAGGRLLRLPAVCELTGLGRSMIYLLESEGRFPQRVKLTQRAVA